MRSLITFISLLILGACDSGQNKTNDTVKANDTAATDYGLDTSIDTDTGTDSGSDTGEDPITIPTEIVLDQYSMLLPGTTATDSVEAMVYNSDRMRIPNAVVSGPQTTRVSSPSRTASSRLLERWDWPWCALNRRH